MAFTFSWYIAVYQHCIQLSKINCECQHWLHCVWLQHSCNRKDLICRCSSHRLLEQIFWKCALCMHIQRQTVHD